MLELLKNNPSVSRSLENDTVGLYPFRKEDARLLEKYPSSHPTYLLKNCKELRVIAEDMEIYVFGLCEEECVKARGEDERGTGDYSA